MKAPPPPTTTVTLRIPYFIERTYHASNVNQNESRTEEVSQPLISWLKLDANQNMDCMVVTYGSTNNNIKSKIEDTLFHSENISCKQCESKWISYRGSIPAADILIEARCKVKRPFHVRHLQAIATTTLRIPHFIEKNVSFGQCESKWISYQGSIPATDILIEAQCRIKYFMHVGHL